MKRLLTAACIGLTSLTFVGCGGNENVNATVETKVEDTVVAEKFGEFKKVDFQLYEVTFDD